MEVAMHIRNFIYPLSSILKLALFLIVLSSGIVIAAEQKKQSTWLDVKGDSSRAELFARITRSRLQEEGKLDDDKAVSFALEKEFLFPHDVKFDDIKGVARQDSIFGIDISHYTNSALDFSKLNFQGVSFVYVKATQGVGYRDAKFTGFWKALSKLPKEQKVYRGAYHFLSSRGSGEDQAKSYLRLLKESGGSTDNDMPPVLDLEWDIQKGSAKDGWNNKKPEEIIEAALAWLEYVERNGAAKKIPMLYTARSWWRERIGSEALFSRFSKYKLWIADYSGPTLGSESPNTPNKQPWHLWQFTANSKLNVGYSDALDANIFKGSIADFNEQFEVK
jgi:lysozyme